jgi:GT2 family glycosyltransferase
MKNFVVNTSKIAIVIVTWNKVDDICHLIGDVHQLNSSNMYLDIFVVDNASSDGTQDLIQEKYPHIKVLQTGFNLGGSGGFSYGLNFVKDSGYDYIWLLDNDVRLDRDALVSLVSILAENPKIGLVGSQIRKLENPSVIHEMGIYVYPKKAHLKNEFGNSSLVSVEKTLTGKSYVNVDLCSAASLLVRSQIVNQIGVFEDYFLHFDDVEWCLRARQASWLVAASPRSIVWHPSPETKQRPWIIYYDERNLCYCWLKHKPELLLKRIRVLVPKLLFYTLTGRYFLVEIYFQAFNDFLLGVKGEMRASLPFIEYQLEDIIVESCPILADSIICTHKSQAIKLQQIGRKYDLIFWNQPKNLLEAINIYLISRFGKVDVLGLFPINRPNLVNLFLAKDVCFFTGTGYAIAALNFRQLCINFLKTCYQIFQIYCQVRNKVRSL